MSDPLIRMASSAAPIPAVDAHQDLFNRAVKLCTESVALTSRRVYEHTFRGWQAFTGERGLSVLALSPENVLEFVNAGQMAKSTRQRRLSFMRSLVKSLYIVQGDERWERLSQRLKLLKVKADATTRAGQTRDKKALRPDEVHDAFRVWRGDDLQATRNRALLAVAFYAGLRRSEIVALRWNDIDLERGIITVRHGKGDKQRETVLVTQIPIQHLKAWQGMQAAHAGSEPRRYVFCALVGRGRKAPGDLASDAPMTTDALYHVFKRSGDFAPHDARRTLITNLLENGVSVADTQAQAGHANPQTTLHYAQKADALTRKGRLKLSY